MKKVTGSTTTVFVFSGTKVIAEYVGGSLNKEYIYSGSALVATHDAGTLKYHHSDHLSIRVTTNTSGGIIAEQGHYPFGESWYQGSGGSKIQFTSYERDAESGDDYAMARYYISRLGRFSSPDPIAGSLTNPQSLNRFAYVRNSPITLTDPSGLTPEGENDPMHPAHLFYMEAPVVLNTWGAPTCGECQMPMWMLIDRNLSRALDDLNSRIREVVMQGRDVNVTISASVAAWASQIMGSVVQGANQLGTRAFLWTHTETSTTVQALNAAAASVLRFGSLTVNYAPGVPPMSPRLQAYIIDVLVAAGVQSANISATTNGRHSPTSFHYVGLAVDIYMINGTSVRNAASDPQFGALIALIQHTANNPSIGIAAENFGPAGLYSGGRALDPRTQRGQRILNQHQGHLHIAAPR